MPREIQFSRCSYKLFIFILECFYFLLKYMHMSFIITSTKFCTVHVENKTKNQKAVTVLQLLLNIFRTRLLTALSYSCRIIVIMRLFTSFATENIIVDERRSIRITHFFNYIKTSQTTYECLLYHRTTTDEYPC